MADGKFKSTRATVKKLARAAAEAIAELEGDAAPLASIHEQLTAAWQRPVESSECAAHVALTLVAGRAAYVELMRHMQRQHGVDADSPSTIASRAHGNLIRFLAASPEPLATLWTWIATADDEVAESNVPRVALALCREVDAILAECKSESPFGFEELLAAFQPRQRQRHGVYFTPPELARFIVARADQALREDFGLVDGLADATTWRDMPRLVLRRDQQQQLTRHKLLNEPFVSVLDPAVGDGVFLVEVIRLVHRTLRTKWQTDDESDSETLLRRWNDHVSRRLLPNLVGLEWMLAPAVLACARFASCLLETGYAFDADCGPQIWLTDTLLSPVKLQPSLLQSSAVDNEVDRWRVTRPATVILGNPPFSGISQNHREWVAELLHGKDPTGRTVANYFEVDGQKLGEKKVWLQDDYVKFLRYAHWRIEKQGCGVLGFVTNHGYLDNVSFRGMRQSLLQTFPKVAVLDLHGNRKKYEAGLAGQVDECVFDIDHGVAVGVFSRPMKPASSQFHFGELWGRRVDKLAQLHDGPIPLSRHSPTAPHYFFSSHRSTIDATQGGKGELLTLVDLMPVNSTAAVTARDSFVVAFTRDEIIERMNQFCDLSISDDTLREKFFSRTRSRNHAKGDSRGWKLSEARRLAREQSDLACFIQPCLYRPFDKRFVFWADWMIDWPRPEVNHHVVGRDNLSLITRRRILPSQPANFFLVSDVVVLDGVIRSDNRGSESFFPRTLWDGNERRDNFAAVIEKEINPGELMPVLYAAFHASSYREKYFSHLCHGFPPIALPRNENLWQALLSQGQRLIDGHLLANVPNDTASWNFDPFSLGRKFPRWHGQQLSLSEEVVLENVSERVWLERIGGYQICRKWLRSRAGREFTAEDGRTLRAIVAAIEQTHAAIAAIDRLVASHGGFDEAMQTWHHPSTRRS